MLILGPVSMVIMLFSFWLTYRQITVRFYDRVSFLIGLVIVAHVLVGFLVRPGKLLRGLYRRCATDHTEVDTTRKSSAGIHR